MACPSSNAAAARRRWACGVLFVTVVCCTWGVAHAEEEKLCWVSRLGQYTEIDCPEGIYIEWDLTDDTPVYSDQVNTVDVNFYWDEGFPVLESNGDLVQHMNLHSCRMVECSPAYPTIGNFITDTMELSGGPGHYEQQITLADGNWSIIAHAWVCWDPEGVFGTANASSDPSDYPHLHAIVRRSVDVFPEQQELDPFLTAAIVAGVVFVIACLTVIVKLTSKDKKTRSGAFAVLFIGIADWVTDVNFVRYLWQYNLNSPTQQFFESIGASCGISTGFRTEAVIAGAVILFAFFVNIVVVYRILRAESASPAFSKWWREHLFVASLISALSTSNTESLLMLNSRMWGWKCFSAPFRRPDAPIHAGIISNILEDVPQLAIQTLVFVRSADASFSVVISMLLSLLSLMYGMSRRAALYATRKISKDDDDVVKAEDLEMSPNGTNRVGGDKLRGARNHRRNSTNSDASSDGSAESVPLNEDFEHSPAAPHDAPHKNGNGAAALRFGRISRLDTEFSMSCGPPTTTTSSSSPRNRRGTSIQSSRRGGGGFHHGALAIDLDSPATSAVVPRVRKYSESRSRNQRRTSATAPRYDFDLQRQHRPSQSSRALRRGNRARARTPPASAASSRISEENRSPFSNRTLPSESVAAMQKSLAAAASRPSNSSEGDGTGFDPRATTVHGSFEVNKITKQLRLMSPPTEDDERVRNVSSVSVSVQRHSPDENEPAW